MKIEIEADDCGQLITVQTADVDDTATYLRLLSSAIKLCSGPVDHCSGATQLELVPVYEVWVTHEGLRRTEKDCLLATFDVQAEALAFKARLEDMTGFEPDVVFDVRLTHYRAKSNVGW